MSSKHRAARLKFRKFVPSAERIRDFASVSFIRKFESSFKKYAGQILRCEFYICFRPLTKSPKVSAAEQQARCSPPHHFASAPCRASASTSTVPSIIIIIILILPSASSLVISAILKYSC